MNEPTIGFVGGGNMARSLIGGLIADGCDAARIWVADPEPQQLQTLSDAFGVNTTTSNPTLVEQSGVVVLAVKPQVLREVAGEIAASVRAAGPLVISIAAGVREATLEGWLGKDVAVVRTMPNTPALLRCGATALHANAAVSDVQRDQAESIMRAVGVTLWLDDEFQMDAVTALSGSGPAYFFLIMEIMEQAGIKLGLTAQAARLLTLQTAFGAAKMALESEDDTTTLRERVTSPGGTTERAVERLREGGLDALFAEALGAARDRASELADLLGEN